MVLSAGALQPRVHLVNLPAELTLFIELDESFNSPQRLITILDFAGHPSPSGLGSLTRPATAGRS
jgi:hypothetical protein